MDAIAHMQHICTVQTLQVSVYGEQEPFDTLCKLTIDQLQELRDELIPLHNKKVKDKNE